MDINLTKEKRVFIDTKLGEILVRQNSDGTVSVSIEGVPVALAPEAQNAFKLIPTKG